jgi:hypothetical protein
MKTLAKFLSFIFLLIICTSCKKTEIKPNICNMTYYKGFSDFNGSYTYNSQNQLTQCAKTNDVGGMRFEYNAEGKLYRCYNKLNRLSFSNYPTSSYAEYTYGDNVITEKYYKTESYTYDGSGRILQEETRYDLDAQGKILKRTDVYILYGETNTYSRYEYNSNGNISKEYFFADYNWSGKEELRIEYTSYDNNKNPFFQNEALRILAYSGSFSHMMSKNNPITMISYDYDSKGNTYKYQYTNSYDYNNGDYPTSSLTGGAVYQYECK